MYINTKVPLIHYYYITVLYLLQRIKENYCRQIKGSLMESVYIIQLFFMHKIGTIITYILLYSQRNSRVIYVLIRDKKVVKSS